MDWRVKGVVQKVLGGVPGGDKVHYMLQRRAGVLRHFERECDIKAIDFTKLATSAGLDLEIDTSRPHPDRLRQLDAIQVDPCFAHYTREQLAITSVDFVARKPAPVSVAVPRR